MKQEKSAEIVNVTRMHKKTYAPQLYDLTELQREASRMFGYSPKETLSIMQSLYEHHKAVTYPRTDSRYLSSDIVETLPRQAQGCADEAVCAACDENLAFADQGRKIVCGRQQGLRSPRHYPDGANGVSRRFERQGTQDF
ncbi:topoisomerase IA [Brevibacillus sp. CF112]|nr:topoisomerase IA [Brevibacillus sp. CF112]